MEIKRVKICWAIGLPHTKQLFSRKAFSGVHCSPSGTISATLEKALTHLSLTTLPNWLRRTLADKAQKDTLRSVLLDIARQATIL